MNIGLKLSKLIGFSYKKRRNESLFELKESYKILKNHIFYKTFLPIAKIDFRTKKGIIIKNFCNCFNIKRENLKVYDKFVQINGKRYYSKPNGRYICNYKDFAIFVIYRRKIYVLTNNKKILI